MSKRTFFELNCFGLRYVYKEWINMVNSRGKESIAMVMGQFSTCMEKTKQTIHLILTDKISDFSQLVNKLDAKLQE